RDVISHFQGAFAALGILTQVKTDNGPGYIATRTQQFFALWGVRHVTGIPHSPTRQAIIECAHQT
ncbi:POK10 protein, partial [Chordeiles acutipennis]|nr:POK10 protein [Chordeiles acutipennis]